NWQDTFPAKLEGYLKERTTGKDVEVINSGVTGFGPDQSLLKMSQEIDVYHPSVVVLQIFADNDFGDIVRNRLFDLDRDGATLVATKAKREIDPMLTTGEAVRPDFLDSFAFVHAARNIGNRLRRSPRTAPPATPQSQIARLVQVDAEE